VSILWLILLVLGIVQGFTEFLPVSSSGHLVIVEQIEFIRIQLHSLGEDSILVINVAFHLATLLAVMVFMFKDLVLLIRGFFSAIFSSRFDAPEFKISINILFACLPAGIAGFLFKDFISSLFSSALAVFFLLILNGIILLLANKIPVKDRKIEEIGVFRSLLVGLCQAAAIMPGISRSGMTIIGGMMIGLKPLDSARFSFLIAIPVIAGAGMIEGLHAMKGGLSPDLWMPLIFAMVITFIIALIALKILVTMVTQIRFHLFGYYTIVVGIIGVVVSLLLQ